MLQKYVFIFSILLFKKLYIFILIQKIIFVKSFKENIFIFNQDIFAFKKFLFLFTTGCFSYKIYVCIYIYIHNIYIYIYIYIFDKKNVFNEMFLMGEIYSFYSMIFGSQIWSSICQGNRVKLLFGLYSDSDTRVNHKKRLQITLPPLSEVHFYKQQVLYWTVSVHFIGSSTVIDCIVTLTGGNLCFFLAA